MTRKSKIMIIDPLEEQRDLTADLLKSKGYIIVIPQPIRTAAKVMTAEHPDLILLDIQAASLARSITADEKNPPLVFTVSRPSPAKIRKVFEMGGCDYIARPFVKNEFLSRIATQLDRVKQQKALDDANKALSDFFLAVSHDMKAPFTIIPTLIDILSAELCCGERDKISDLMHRINTESDKIRHTLEGIYEYSKLYSVLPEIPDDIEHIPESLAMINMDLALDHKFN